MLEEAVRHGKAGARPQKPDKLPTTTRAYGNQGHSNYFPPHKHRQTGNRERVFGYSPLEESEHGNQGLPLALISRLVRPAKVRS